MASRSLCDEGTRSFRLCCRCGNVCHRRSDKKAGRTCSAKSNDREQCQLCTPSECTHYVGHTRAQILIADNNGFPRNNSKPPYCGRRLRGVPCITTYIFELFRRTTCSGSRVRRLSPNDEVKQHYIAETTPSGRFAEWSPQWCTRTT